MSFTPACGSILAFVPSQKPLVEFKAGKMLIRGKMVIPDKRKGKIELAQSPDDQLMHFRWKDRSTGQVETVTLPSPPLSLLSLLVCCARTGQVRQSELTPRCVS